MTFRGSIFCVQVVLSVIICAMISYFVSSLMGDQRYNILIFPSTFMLVLPCYLIITDLFNPYESDLTPPTIEPQQQT